MQVYGQLQNAALEILSSDPTSSVQGRVWYNSTTGKIMVDDGVAKRALHRNDQLIIMGSSATASQNVRMNRSGSALIQLVTGDDVTAEGSLSASLAQLSARFENYTFSGKPAAGNAGRVIYATDSQALFVDTGSTWNTVGSGSGGGGGSPSWLEAGPNSATPDIDPANSRVYYFGQGLTQTLYAMVKVPSGYTPGKPITMKIAFYSPDSSGTALMQSVTTLIRPGTDTITATANQKTSTNTALTLSSSTANITQVVTLDLTNASGQISGVSVAGGNYLNVMLTRGSDTGTSDLVFQPFLTEVAFS